MEILDCQVHAPFGISEWATGMDESTRQSVAVHITEAALRAVGVDGALVNWSSDFNRLAYETFPGKFRSIQNFYAPGTVWADLMGEPSDLLPAGVVLPLDGDRDLNATIIDLQKRTGLASLRLECGFMPGRDLDIDVRIFQEGGYDPLLAAGRDFGLPVCIWIGGALEALPTVLERFPDVSIIVDHLGIVPKPFSDSGLKDLPHLLALAQYPKVAVKLSGVVDLSAEPYPFRDVWPAIRQVVDAFGAERVLWGSDFTVHASQSYAEAVGFLLYSDVLNESEKELVFGANLRRIFNWPKDG